MSRTRGLGLAKHAALAAAAAALQTASMFAVFACTLPHEPWTTLTGTPAGAGGEAPATSEAPRACFGDSAPEVVATEEMHPRDILANGMDIYWLAGGIRRMRVATKEVTTFASSQAIAALRAVDARDLFAVTEQDTLVAFDLETGRERTIVDTVRIFHAAHGYIYARYLLDADYVYFGDPGLPYADGHHYAVSSGMPSPGFFRVRRDGSAKPELLGPEPSNPYVAGDGYAYGVSTRGVVRHALGPGSSEVISRDLFNPLAVNGNWLFGVRVPQLEFWALPLPAAAQGGAPAPSARRIAPAAIGYAETIADGNCLYWKAHVSGYAWVHRSRLDDGSTRELASGSCNARYGTILIASDARFLYWSDYGGGRILRWAN